MLLIILVPVVVVKLARAPFVVQLIRKYFVFAPEPRVCTLNAYSCK